MLKKPNLADSVICSVLKEQYGVTPNALDFLPIGNDAGAWVYRVAAGGDQAYFLKLRSLPVDPASLLIPHWLHAAGISAVVRPLLSQAGNLWEPAGAFGLIVYPYIDGRSGMEQGLLPRQWVEFGRILRQIHAAPLGEEIRQHIPVESFQPKWSGMVGRVLVHIETESPRNENEAAMAELWRARKAEIEKIARRCAELGRRLCAQSQALVLCHADIHTANLLVDGQGGLHIVDWDQPVLAPKERDLMFVVGDNEEQLFFEGYGKVEIHSLALAYYRYEWVVQEFGDYAERVYFRADLGEETAKDSIRGFKQLFDPGDVVDGALEMEKILNQDQVDWRTSSLR